jgi:hypothetical protein
MGTERHELLMEKGDGFPMIRAKIWFRCAAMHDPVTPIIVQPAVLSWEAKYRDVDLTIERAFKGDELVMRMKGWVTIDVKTFLEAVNRYGRLKVLDEKDLCLELESDRDFEQLEKELVDQFGDQVNLERM